MTLRPETRAASIALTHAMTIGITSILVMSLLLSTGTFLTSQQETVARSQASDVGGDVATLIDTADRLNATGENVTATFEPSYPEQIAGSPYRLQLETDAPPTSGTLYVRTRAVSHEITIGVNTTTPLEDSGARGENPSVHLCLDSSHDQYIELGSCSR
jgi:hypothetical protein